MIKDTNLDVNKTGRLQVNKSMIRDEVRSMDRKGLTSCQ